MYANKFQINAYYLLSMVVLSVFVFRGSDTINQSDYTIILLILIPFIAAAILRRKLENKYILTSGSIEQPKRQIVLELGLYAGVATVISCGLYYIYQTDLFLTFSIFVWSMILGYFTSIDSALHRVRECFRSKEPNIALDVQSVSITHKVNIFLSITVLIITIAMAMSAYKYLSFSADSSMSAVVDLRHNFIIDTLFILGIITSLTTRIIFSYSMNVQTLFRKQMDILKRVEDGDLSDYIPVLTRDEFGVIAQQTNRMIHQLRGKAKVLKTLESIVSPNIMDKLLNEEKRATFSEHQAEEYDIAILFCDLRKFTTYAETAPPEEVIFFLNAYFTKIADVVAEHGGIVNKFMGDAILAIFGVEGEDDYVQRAVDTAFDIVLHSNSARMRDGTKFDIGIGIHKGKTAAGTIGSADRFEYMFIGDSVNTASRLDGLTKRLNHKIVISGEVFVNLSDERQAHFIDLGEQKIRGRSQPVQVYGAVPRATDDDKKEKVVDLSAARLCRL